MLNFNYVCYLNNGGHDPLADFASSITRHHFGMLIEETQN